MSRFFLDSTYILLLSSLQTYVEDPNCDLINAAYQADWNHGDRPFVDRFTILDEAFLMRKKDKVPILFLSFSGKIPVYRQCGVSR